MTLDAHGDNLRHIWETAGVVPPGSPGWPSYPGENGPACSPGHERSKKFKEQVAWFREKGTTYTLPGDSKGITQICDEIMERIHLDTDKVFMNVDFDVLDLLVLPG